MEFLDLLKHIQIIPTELIQFDIVDHIIDTSVNEDDVGAFLLGGQTANPAGEDGGIVAGVADMGAGEGVVLQEGTANLLGDQHPPGFPQGCRSRNKRCSWENTSCRVWEYSLQRC